MSGFLSAGIVGGPDIPDTSMFQNPTNQWWAGQGIDVADGQTASNWDDALSSVTATAVDNPTFSSDQAGFQAVDYDAGSDGTSDAHDIPNSASPSGAEAISFASLIYVNDVQSDQKITYTGNAQTGTFTGAGLLINSGSVGVQAAFVGDTVGGSPQTGQWMTVGGSIAANGDIVAYHNGSQADSSTGNADPNFSGDNSSIGYRRSDTTHYLDGFVSEIIWSSGVESGQAFSDYHQDRLG